MVFGILDVGWMELGLVAFSCLALGTMANGEPDQSLGKKLISLAMEYGQTETGLKEKYGIGQNYTIPILTTLYLKYLPNLVTNLNQL